MHNIWNDELLLTTNVHSQYIILAHLNPSILIPQQDQIIADVCSRLTGLHRDSVLELH